jgi:hypothetical protein
MIDEKLSRVHVVTIAKILDMLHHDHGINTSVTHGQLTAEDYETIIKGLRWGWSEHAIVREIVERHERTKEGAST